MKDEYTPLLRKMYNEAKFCKPEDIRELEQKEKEHLQNIVTDSDIQKGVYSVLVTSLATKIINPRQDIRKHQKNMSGGYSGRTVDTSFVTPFLKSVKFPAMAESGWLTRSLEQNFPYDLSYRGKIRNKIVKESFLSLLDNIETKKRPPKEYMLYLFKCSLIKQKEGNIRLLKPVKKESKSMISEIVRLLAAHFYSKYKVQGSSRLPVLAIYAVYQCMIEELERFNGKTLAPLESHTSADRRSGAIGDVEIKNSDDSVFEAVEVKHNISITPGIVREVFDKFMSHPVMRFYVLTTASLCVKDKHRDEMEELLQKIRKEHGCQVVVNGVMPTLTYYLRLLNDLDRFVECYKNNLSKDGVIKAEHKTRWNELVKQYLKLV